MKHSADTFVIDNDHAKDMQNKLSAYRELSKDKRTLHLVMVTTSGVARGSNYNMVQNEVAMDFQGNSSAISSDGHKTKTQLVNN